MANQIINNDNLTVTAQPFGAEACPSTPAELHSLFGSYTSVANKGAAIVSSETEPTSSDHDKLWLRVDSSGDPFALYFRNVTNSRWEPANGVPIGSIQAFAGAAAPSGWLLCDHSTTYDGTTSPYDLLYGVIGTTYGGTSSAFKVPDMRGRVAAGKDDMGGVAATRLTNPAEANGGVDGTVLGGDGGSEWHVLTVDQMPDHTHPYDQPVPSSAGRHSGGHDQDISSGQPTGSTGGGLAHNNVQPTMILNYMIRYM